MAKRKLNAKEEALNALDRLRQGAGNLVSRGLQAYQKASPYIPFAPQVPTPQSARQAAQRQKAVVNYIKPFYQGYTEPPTAPPTQSSFRYLAGRTFAGMSPVSTGPIAQIGQGMVRQVPRVVSGLQQFGKVTQPIYSRLGQVGQEIARGLPEQVRPAAELGFGLTFGGIQPTKPRPYSIKFHPEDEKVMQNFAAIAQTLGKKANRVNFGQLGKDAQNIVEYYFGRKFGTLTNTNVAQLFDYALARRKGGIPIKPRGQLPMGLSTQETEGLAQQALKGKPSQVIIQKDLQKTKGQPLIGQESKLSPRLRLEQSKKVLQAFPKPALTGEKILNIKNKSQELKQEGLLQSDKGTLKTIIPQGKERGFVTTVKEAKVTKPDVAKTIKGYYSPRSTQGLIQRAQTLVTQGYDNAKQRIFNEPLTDETNAIGQEVMRQSQNAGRYDEAVQVAEELAKKGTQAGQTVQAFSIWSRMTPEGMLRYAQQQIQKGIKETPLLNKILRRGGGKLDIEDTKFITETMKKANATVNEQEKTQLVKQVFERIGKKLPFGISDVLDEYRYNNMLSNPLTHLRNAVSNIEQTYITRPATLLAEGRPKEAIKYELGAIKALPDGFKSFFKALKEGTPLGKLDQQVIAELKPIKPKALSRIPIVGKLANLYNLPSSILEGTDQFFKTIIKSGEQARGVSEAEAAKIAEYSLFRQWLHPEGQGYLLNKIDDLTKGVYQLRKVGLGWFIPFIRTPMNIAKQWIEYSPFGVATIPGAVNKRSQVAKTLVGSLFTLVGANLALEGKTTWSAPTDPKEKELFYAAGKKPFSVKVGDKWIPMQSLGVFAWALGLPAAVQHYTEESRTALTDDMLTKLAKSVFGIGKFWSQQTFVSGLSSFVKLAEGDVDYTIPKNLAFTAGQVKPWSGLTRYISTVIDPIFRKPKGFVQQFISDVPGLTKTLPAYTTPSGEPSRRNITNYIAPYGMGIENPYYSQQLKDIQGIKREVAPYQITPEEKQQKQEKGQMFLNMLKTQGGAATSDYLRQSYQRGEITKEDIKGLIKDYRDEQLNRARGVTTSDEYLKNQPIKVRARYVVGQIKDKSPEERRAILIDMLKKRVVTKDVLREIVTNYGQEYD